MKLSPGSTIKLASGAGMPAIGLGTWKVPDGQAASDAVFWALSAGYRLIDTAMIYRNEMGVGEGLRRSGLPREEIFVTTKLWIADQGYDGALAAMDASLGRLGVDYVDLYLIHWPYSDEDKTGHKRQETWRAMEELLREHKARAIGVSNYTIEHLKEMESYAATPPAVNQFELHPFLFQKDLVEYCRRNHIVVEAYSPLAHGEKLSDMRVAAIAAKHGKSAAQVLIRWGLQHDFVVLPKSTHKERIEQNIDVFGFALDSEDMKRLDSLNENFRTCWDPSK